MSLTGAKMEDGRKETGERVRSALDDLEVRDSDYPRAVEMVKSSIFKISGPQGHGTGFLLSNGYILTNEHVTHHNETHVAPDGEPFVPSLPLPITPPLLHGLRITPDANYVVQCFSDDDRVPGQEFRAAPVLLADGSRAIHKDMSLLRLPPNARLPGDMRPVTIGSARVGQPTMIMGNPGGTDSHVGFGRVSRNVVMDAQGWGNPQWANVPFIVSDAPLNSGNSGGAAFALRKERGPEGSELKVELIGMPTYGVRGMHGLGGSIRADYIAWAATTKWGIPLMTPTQVVEYRRQFPTVE